MPQELPPSSAAWSTTPRSSRPATRRCPTPWRRTPPAGDEWYADLVGSFVVTDVKLPEGRRAGSRVSIVVTGGAGAIGGALHLAGRDGCATSPASRSRCATSTTWPATPAAWSPRSTRPAPTGSSRRRRRSTSSCRSRSPAPGWLGAADAVAEAELRLKFRTGGLESHLFPTAPTLAALDRRRAGPRDAVQVHGRAAQRGAAHAARTGFEHHGFLNVLLATRLRLRRRRAPTRSSRSSTSGSPTWSLDAGATRATTRWPGPAGGSRRSAPAASTSRSTTCSPSDCWRTPMSTWVDGAAGSLFDVDNLPYGVFSRRGEEPRVGVRIGDQVLDLRRSRPRTTPDAVPPALSLNPLMALGPPARRTAARRWSPPCSPTSRARPRRAAPRARSPT